MKKISGILQKKPESGMLWYDVEASGGPVPLTENLIRDGL
jgi:hypothetical protein